ncbi:hypothetical protein ACM0IS_02920 [Mycoplasma aquilae ATCC BAA-1896]|uniref:hypothetical protein n=1 Tax=Mycoplasma aquilae TaxID=1312741 RepID=UPI003A853AEE
MKKIWILLNGSIAALATTSLVVSCGNPKAENTNPTPEPDKPIIADNKKTELVAKINLLAQINPEEYEKYKDNIKKNLTDQEIETLTGEINKIISSYAASFNSLQAQVKEAQSWVDGLNLQKILFETLKPEINKFTNYLTSISVKKINTISNEQITLFNSGINKKKTALIQAKEEAEKQITKLQSELTNEIISAKEQLQTLKQYSIAEFETLQAELNGFEQTQNSVENLASLNALSDNIKSLIVKIEQKNSTYKTQKEQLIASYNQLNTKVLELIKQVKTWNVDYATTKENLVSTLSQNIANENIDNIQKANSQLNQLLEELNENIQQHNSISQKVTNLIQETKTGLLNTLDTDELKELHTKLSEYLNGITTLNIPNDKLAELLNHLQQTITEITAERDAILSHDKEEKEAIDKLKQQVSSKIQNINSFLIQIEKYDSAYAANIKKELNDLNVSNVDSSAELKMKLDKLVSLDNIIIRYISDRNKILEILKTTSVNNINDYIKTFSRGKLYNTGQNNLLQQAKNIQEFLKQDFTTKSLSQLRDIRADYLNKIKMLEQDYQRLMNETEEIQSIALKLKNFLDQKAKLEKLSEKENEIKTYIDNLPIGNIELLSGDSVVSTIQKLKEYETELKIS